MIPSNKPIKSAYVKFFFFLSKKYPKKTIGVDNKGLIINNK